MAESVRSPGWGLGSHAYEPLRDYCDDAHDHPFGSRQRSPLSSARNMSARPSGSPQQSPQISAKTPGSLTGGSRQLHRTATPVFGLPPGAGAGGEYTVGTPGALLRQLEAEVRRGRELLDQLAKVHSKQCGLLQQCLHEEVPSLGAAAGTLGSLPSAGRLSRRYSDHPSETLKGVFEGAEDDDGEEASSEPDDSQEDRGILHKFSNLHRGFSNTLTNMQAMVEDVSDTVTPKNAMQRTLVPILYSTQFNTFLGLVIASNGILFAMQVHCTVVAGLDRKPPQWWAGWDRNMWLAERVCVWIFIAEMCLRVAAEQCQFFTGPNRKWNIFEGAIVILSVLEMVSERGDEVAVIRVLRLVRAVRIIKLFSFMSHLRLMLFSLVSCFYALLWALVLLLMVIFCFAAFFENVIAHHALDSESGLLARTLPSGGTVEESLQENWGGMFLAIRTLSYSIAGGVDWGEVIEPFWEMSWGYGMIYVVFVAIMLFGMLNVMVGVFVQETANVLLLDRELVLDKEVETLKALRDQLTSLFSEIDKNNTMYISQRQLEKSLEEPRIQAFFKHLGIDMSTRSDEFFALLDVDGNGQVSLMEFQDVCMQVQGGARPLDVMALSRRIDRYMERLNVRLNRLEHLEIQEQSRKATEDFCFPSH